MAEATASVRVEAATPAYQAYQILRWAYTLAPIVAGLDKFFYLLADWTQYLAPVVPRMTGMDGRTFMYVVGVVEVLAGVVVFVRPRYGAYLVAAWLAGIIANLLLIPAYLDIALRDFGLALGALALGRLSMEFDRPELDRG